MFETARRRHPLHSFRFWFLILGAATLTLAWKFNLLPFRIGPADTGRLAEKTFTEIDPAADAAPQQAAEPELTLPFTESEESLELPTITPDSSLIRTAAVEPTDATTQPSEGSALGFTESDFNDASTPPIPTTTHAVTRDTSFDDWEDDWPTQAPSGTATAAADSSRILQTSATVTSFETTGEQDSGASIGSFATAEFSNSSAPAPAGIDFTQIDQLLATGLIDDEVEAHRLLSTMYWQQPEARPALRQRIDTLAQNIYFLNSRHYMDAYQIQPGETLQQIAGQYDVPWQYLAKLNRVDPRKVRAGQRLKVIKGPFSAIIDLSDYELTLHAHGYYVTRFPVGIGKDGSTPVGNFTVLEKLVDPTYYGPDGVIKHDDPSNPLGERWIDLGDSYGIHGTIDPASVGKSESRGCIRLHNDDVAALFDLLSIGSDVTIRP